MKQYYQDYFTERSWQTLIELNQKIKFILIGGWAVYLYTKALKSKDIDLIADFDALSRLKQNYGLVKNDRLKKYEIIHESIHIDIYLPHYSHLVIPVEKMADFHQKLEGFTLLKKELLLLSKQKAYMERRGSIKGEKDKIDIIALALQKDFDFDLYHN